VCTLGPTRDMHPCILLRSLEALLVSADVPSLRFVEHSALPPDFGLYI